MAVGWFRAKSRAPIRGHGLVVSRTRARRPSRTELFNCGRADRCCLLRLGEHEHDDQCDSTAFLIKIIGYTTPIVYIICR
jgi:hypothetical protein